MPTKVRRMCTGPAQVETDGYTCDGPMLAVVSRLVKDSFGSKDELGEDGVELCR